MTDTLYWAIDPEGKAVGTLRLRRLHRHRHSHIALRSRTSPTTAFKADQSPAVGSTSRVRLREGHFASVFAVLPTDSETTWMATDDDLNRFRAWAAMIVVIGTTIAVLGDTFLLGVSLSSRNLDALVYLSLAFFGLDVAAERRDQIFDALEKAGREYLNGGENGENDE